MVKVENEPRGVQSNKDTNVRHQKPTESVTVPFLQEFLSTIRLRRAMEDEVPGSVTLTKLRAIEEKLDSPEQELKMEASNELADLLRIKEVAEVKTRGVSTAEDIVATAKISESRKEALLSTAQGIDALMARSEHEIIPPEELQKVYGSIQELSAGLGLRENAEGVREVVSRLELMQARLDARQFIDEPNFASSPIKEYEREFEVGKEGKILKLRDVDPTEAQQLQKRLDDFKSIIHSELVEDNGRRLDELTPDQLIERLKETTFWQANMKYLQGSKRWAGNENIDRLRDMLGRIEAQYQATLENKLVEEVGRKFAAEHLDVGLVRESVTKSLRDRRRFLRTEYDFEKNVPAGRKIVDVLTDEVAGGAKKIQIENARVSRRESRIRTSDEHKGGHVVGEGSGIETDEERYLESRKRQGRDILQLQEILTKKLGLTEQELQMGVGNPALGEEWYRRAESMGLPSADLDLMRRHLVDASILGRTGLKSPEQVELERLRDSGQHNKFLIKFKAYVERVGLREASSDWEFAIMMRKAKEMIGRFNPDAGEKLDQWQEALFAPSITTVPEKTFYEIQTKIMNQSRLDHEFGENYANWEAMQVTAPDGTKKVISVAAFYQLLQRPDVARRILNGPVNGNDSVIQQILAEHIWGENAVFHSKLFPSEQMRAPEMWVTFTNSDRKIDNVDVSYFSNDGKVNPSQNEKLSMESFIDQSMWMTHYARTIWHYSGEWETFLRDFPEDQLTEANKRLLNIGAGFRDYGLDYGKFDVGYENLAKAGVLLQDYRTYKASNVLVANIRHKLYDQHIVDARRGDEIGKGLWKLVQKRANIDGEYKPVVGMRTVDEIRLMGNLPKTEEEAWNWFKKTQEKIGRKGVLDYSRIAELKKKNFDSLTSTEEAWVVQMDEINKWMADLKVQREALGKLKLTKEELAPLLRKQSLLTTGEYNPNGGDIDEFLRNFEYSSIIDHAELKKGSDPLDYQNYSNARAEAAGLMSEVLNGSPSAETIDKLYGAMKNFMPPEQVQDWFAAYTKRRVQLRTNQIMPYEIAMTDLEWWKLRKKRGEEHGHEPPETIRGLNPAQYKIKDDRGDNWTVVGADGFKVTKKKMERGNHMWKTRGIPGLKAADIEIQMRRFVGNRWLMPKVAEEITESSFGMGQLIRSYYENRGMKVPEKGLANFLMKYGTKLELIVRKHPAFDDPQWAFWSILNEFWEFTKEVGKDVVKEVAH